MAVIVPVKSRNQRYGHCLGQRCIRENGPPRSERKRRSLIDILQSPLNASFTPPHTTHTPPTPHPTTLLHPPIYIPTSTLLSLLSPSHNRHIDTLSPAPFTTSVTPSHSTPSTRLHPRKILHPPIHYSTPNTILSLTQPLMSPLLPSFLTPVTPSLATPLFHSLCNTPLI